MEELDLLAQESFAHECAIRDAYALRLGEFRPNEKVIKTEYAFAGARARADMRTLDSEHRESVRETGIEPASSAWKAEIIAVRPQTKRACKCCDVQWLGVEGDHCYNCGHSPSRAEAISAIFMDNFDTADEADQ